MTLHAKLSRWPRLAGCLLLAGLCAFASARSKASPLMAGVVPLFARVQFPTDGVARPIVELNPRAISKRDPMGPIKDIDVINPPPEISANARIGPHSRLYAGQAKLLPRCPKSLRDNHPVSIRGWRQRKLSGI